MERLERTSPTRTTVLSNILEIYQQHLRETGLVNEFVLVLRGDDRGDKLEVLNVLTRSGINSDDSKYAQLTKWSQRLILACRKINVPVGRVVNMNPSQYREFLEQPIRQKNEEPGTGIKRLIEIKCT